MEYLILMGVGFAAGAASGMLGIGGGIVIVPLLIALLGYSQKLAQGTSLGLLLLPLGFLAVFNYYKAGFVNIPAVICMAATFVVGSYVSSSFAIGLPDGILKKVFAFFMIIYALKLLWSS